MIARGEWLVPDKFESLVIRVYKLTISSNGFGVDFKLDVIEKFVDKFLYLESFEVLEMLKEIEAKIREDGEQT